MSRTVQNSKIEIFIFQKRLKIHILKVPTDLSSEGQKQYSVILSALGGIPYRVYRMRVKVSETYLN